MSRYFGPSEIARKTGAGTITRMFPASLSKVYGQRRTEGRV